MELCKTIFTIFATLCVCYGYSSSENNVLLNKVELLQDEIAHLKDELQSDGFASKGIANDEETKRSEDNSYLGTCGFETDCAEEFKIESGDGPKWSVVQAKYPRDRSEIIGKYMHASITKEHTKKQFSSFSHEFTVQQQQQCGEFYYHMYNREGCDVARLLVTIECKGSDQTEILFRTTGGSRSYGWDRANVDIKKPAGSECKITWRVSKGLSDEGKVYIDDITMYNRACRQPGAPVEPSQADCVFETGSCSWKQNGSLKWHSNSWGTRTSQTGPQRFFGSRNGNHGVYYYLEADDPNAKFSSSSLVSPKMRSSVDQCMRFMYSMYGAEMGSLNVVKTEDGKESTVMTKSGDQGNKWHEGWIDLPANKDIQIEIKGTVGNGSKSDIAVSEIKSELGTCASNQMIVDCSDSDKCVGTDQTCGAEIKEYTHTEALSVTRSNLLTTIPKISKEWELSVDIKINKVVNGWTNILHFTSTGNNCCDRGDRVPAIFVHSKSTRLHITNAVGWGGNHQYNPTITLNKFATVKMQQKKQADGKYMYTIAIDGKTLHTQHNGIPMEWRDVKVFVSDMFYTPADAEIKNLIFKNNGGFEECDAICNAKLSDPQFVNLKPTPPTKIAAFTPVKNTLKETIPAVAKEYSLSFDIKVKGTESGWSSVVKFTSTDNNCCSRGDRIPAIFVIPRSTRLHICHSIDWSGNRCVNSASLPTDSFTKVEMEQRLVAGKYRYTVKVGGNTISQLNNSKPQDFYDVKIYTGDKFSAAAKADVQNFEFKNLVPVYPCKKLCKVKEYDDVIDGVKVKASNFHIKYCDNKYSDYRINIPEDVRTPRMACLRFYYKLGAATSNCHIQVWHKQHHLKNIYLRKPTNGWVEEKVTINHYIPYGSKHDSVRMKQQINSRCPDVSYAKVELSDGIC